MAPPRALLLVPLALGLAPRHASAQFGCYSPVSHVCDCPATAGDLAAAEDACAPGGGIWTDGCSSCDDFDDATAPSEGPTMLDMECPWSEPVSEVHAAHYGGCVEFPSAVNGSTGDWAEFLVFGGRDVTLYADEASWMDCNTTGSTTILEPVSKGGRDVMITFNQAGKYYLGSNGSCADGLKVIFSIEGETTNETNALSWADENVFAPDIAANATAGHEAFGKGVYHDRQYDAQLHTACEDDVCLDRNASRGSCYYAGEDFHIGHAVFCDVTEVECCGYVNCSSAEQGNRGKFQNGTSHDYYWYAPGFISGQSGCCHCAADCDFAAQDAAKAESGNEDACEYRDVSSPECQRAPSPWSLEYDTIGYLKCPFPEGTSFSDATVRETVSDE